MIVLMENKVEAVKYCPSCDRSLDSSCFSIANDRPDELSGFCRSCKNSIPQKKYKDFTAEEKKRDSVRSKTRYLVKQGEIKPNSHCEDCGQGKDIEAHHPDYNLPAVIIWLCRACHRSLHVEQRCQENSRRIREMTEKYFKVAV